MFDLQGFGALLLSGATVTIQLAVTSLIIGLALGDEIDINDNFAIAVRPGDPLQAKINQSLANIKANGTYDKINQQYFAIPESAMQTSDADTPEQPVAETAGQ